MAESTSAPPLGGKLKTSDLAIPAAVMAVILFMLFPLPSQILDLALGLNLALSVLVLLVTLYTTEPLQFSSFPSLLLIATLVRLSLNVAATRLVLTQGQTGTAAAGRLIESFGMLVGGNNAVVGFVVFLILVIIQFVVITSGAQRVSEVAARFTLDAMPGKQMAIDADLNSGLVTEDEAKRRREKIAREANFYGSMDGATKFVRGDAIAAIIIVAVTILGGFVVGMLDSDMTWMEVLRTFTLLTIGMGLVTQIPALLVSTATGLLVTRSAAESNLGQDVTGQLFSMALPMAILALVLVAMAAAFHNLASIPMLVLAGAAVFAYSSLNRRDKEKNARTAAEAAKPKPREPENVSKLLAVDAMELEIGFGLIPLVDEAQGGDLLDRITMIRRQVALDLGLVVPPIRIRDNMQLGAEAYCVKIRGTEVARGLLMANHFLAINSTSSKDTLPGKPTKEPTFGLPAVWIDEAVKPQAERSGYTVVDLPSVVATHLTEIVRAHAPELLTRQDVQRLVDNYRQGNAAAVDELLPALLSLGDVQKVLQNLLRERIPIRDLGTILESLADHARATKDSDALTEYVRQALFRVITKLLVGADGAIHAVTLDPRLEQTLLAAVTRSEGGSFLSLDPKTAQKILLALSRQIEVLNRKGHPPLVLCSPLVRPYFKRLLDKVLPNLTVISYNELDPKVEIQSAGSIKTGDEEQA
jgi:flagellar biosynthesis protein FlhA